MKLSELPEVNFVDTNKDVVVARLMALYTKITKRTLSRADPIRLFILVVASVVVMLLNKFNEIGKQNLLAYANGENLDHIGVVTGVVRLGKQAATTTMRLQLSLSDRSRVIPKGTRFSTADNVIFATIEDTLIETGAKTVDVKATCTEVGDKGNGFTAGMITTIIDRLPYMVSATNITTSTGGADMEDDAHFRQRIHEAPESFSCAGAVGAYEYHTKKVSTNIADVRVTSPQPGHVVVYPVLADGALAGDELLTVIQAALSDKYMRPLTDRVAVKAPTVKSYDVDITYYLFSGDRDRAVSIQNAVNAAVDDYILWQKSAAGRDVNPSELTRRIMQAGAKRVEVRSPVFAHVKNGTEEDSYEVELAVNQTKSITYGGYEDE